MSNLAQNGYTKLTYKIYTFQGEVPSTIILRLVIVLTTAAPALFEVCTGNDCLYFKMLYFSYTLDYFDAN